MILKCVGEYAGFTVGKEYQASLGSGIFGDLWFNVIDNCGEMRHIVIYTDDFIKVKE